MKQGKGPKKKRSPRKIYGGYLGGITRNAFSRSSREKRKIERAYQEGYQAAYTSYLQNLGYRVKQPWTWRRIKELLKSIVLFILVILAICFFPPTHKLLVSLYESNEIVKGVVDFTVQFCREVFQNLFPPKG